MAGVERRRDLVVGSLEKTLYSLVDLRRLYCLQRWILSVDDVAQCIADKCGLIDGSPSCIQTRQADVIVR
jgi:hypothetical protein